MKKNYKPQINENDIETYDNKQCDLVGCHKFEYEPFDSEIKSENIFKQFRTKLSFKQ